MESLELFSSAIGSQLNPQINLFALSYTEMGVNILVAMLLGFIISYLYRLTHRGLSYSQSFTLTILFVTVIVAVVMMVIGGSLARAFALVGALSIIRFRTVIKDTKDTSYVFLALAIGMAAGTSNYFLAFVGTFAIGGLIIVVNHFNYGVLYKSDFVVRFLFLNVENQDGPYLPIFESYARSHNLLHIEPSGDPDLLRMTFDVSLKEDTEANDFVSALQKLESLSEIVLIASKNDVDY
ncbi:MAG: DUF4956 domain-containing protein [Pseudomonadales bacterium]